MHPQSCSQAQHQIRENEQSEALSRKINQNLGEGRRLNLEYRQAEGERGGGLTKHPLPQKVCQMKASAVSSKTSSPVTRGFSTSSANLTSTSRDT